MSKYSTADVMLLMRQVRWCWVSLCWWWCWWGRFGDAGCHSVDDGVDEAGSVMLGVIDCVTDWDVVASWSASVSTAAGWGQPVALCWAISSQPLPSRMSSSLLTSLLHLAQSLRGPVMVTPSLYYGLRMCCEGVVSAAVPWPQLQLIRKIMH